MRRSAMALAKRITIPQLSPTHTSARVVRFLCEPGTSVEEYRPVLILQCTADLVADPADRPTPGYKPFMLLESLEEGVLKGMVGGLEEKRALTDLVIPHGVTRIREEAFRSDIYHDHDDYDDDHDDNDDYNTMRI